MLVIASRGSQLALWQARWVQARLAALRPRVPHRNHQDHRRQDHRRAAGQGGDQGPVHQGNRGGAARWPRRPGRAQPEGPAHRVARGPGAGGRSRRAKTRATPLVGKRLADSAAGARVGTSSLRRAAQLRKLRPGPGDGIRARQPGYAPAQAGRGPVRRHPAGRRRPEAAGMGRPHRRDSGAGDHVPGRGPGRAGHRNARGGRGLRCVPRAGRCRHARRRDGRARRVAALGGGCQVPIGAHATVDGDVLRMLAVVASPDGAELVRGETEGAGCAKPSASGARLAQSLLERGAREILEAVYG